MQLLGKLSKIRWIYTYSAMRWWSCFDHGTFLLDSASSWSILITKSRAPFILASTLSALFVVPNTLNQKKKTEFIAFWILIGSSDIRFPLCWRICIQGVQRVGNRPQKTLFESAQAERTQCCCGVVSNLEGKYWGMNWFPFICARERSNNEEEGLEFLGFAFY